MAFNLTKLWKQFGPGSLPALQQIEDAVNSVDGKVADADARIDAVSEGVEFAGTLDNIPEGSTNKHFTSTEKTKLAGVAASANNYTHPVNHAPSIITQDSSNRFVTDTEKSTWNAKQAALVSGTNIKTINSQSLLGSENITVQQGIVILEFNLSNQVDLEDDDVYQTVIQAASLAAGVYLIIGQYAVQDSNSTDKYVDMILIDLISNQKYLNQRNLVESGSTKTFTFCQIITVTETSNVDLQIQRSRQDIVLHQLPILELDGVVTFIKAIKIN